MNEMGAPERATRAETRGSAGVWFGVLAGPLGWITLLIVTTELPEFMCSAGATDSSIYGVGLETLIQTAAIVVTALTIVAGLVSLAAWRRERNGESTGDRAAWMGIVGVITSCMFLLLIVPSLLPAAFLSGCERSL